MPEPGVGEHPSFDFLGGGTLLTYKTIIVGNSDLVEKGRILLVFAGGTMSGASSEVASKPKKW